ncbi:MAG: tetratricopeptide repeat protein, partial [Bauldia sp.]
MRLRLKAAALILAPALAVAGTLPASAQAPGAPLVTTTSGAFLAAQAAAAQNDIEAAAWYYSFVLQRDPANTQLASLVFSMWLDIGNIAAAAPIAGGLVEIDPTYEPARLVLATQAIRTAQFEAARTHLDAIEGDPIATLAVGLVNGWVDFGLGDPEAALVRIDALSGEPWYEPFKIYHSALIADAAGLTDRALALAEVSYSIDQSLGPTELLASLLARTGDVARATEVLNAFLAEVPDQPLALARLRAIEAGDFGGPIVADARGGAGQVFYDLATAIGDDGGQTTVPFLQLARRLLPDSSLTALALGDLLQNLDRQLEAINAFDTIDVDDPLYPLAATSAATSEAILGQIDDAIARLTPIAAADPTDPVIALALGNLYRSQERFAETIEAVAPAIDAEADPSPSYWRLYFVRAIGYEREGEFDLAVADFRRALELAPDHPDVLNYLGYSWIDRGENTEEALAMIQRAVEQQPEAGYIVDSLGWAYYKLGDYELAVETLERAVELTPNNPEIFDHLGDAYWRVGRRIEAAYQWNHALIFDPTDEQRARIADKL